MQPAMHVLEMSRTPAFPLSERSALRPLSLLAAIVAAVATIVFSSAQAFSVEGSSMAPSLHNGQLLVVNKLAYWRLDGTPIARLLPDAQSGASHYVFGGPRRGDMVVFQPPTTVEDGDFVKRLIGVPGDTVLVKAGQVFVNGELLDESYVKFPDDYTYPTDGTALRVPAGAYFVLGDNRGASVDSHMGWFVPAENLVGPAVPLPLGSV
jgi:signal peptidase I